MPYLKAVLHCSRIRETGVEDSVVVISQDSWIWLSMFRFTGLLRVLTPLYLDRLQTFGCQQATTTGSASRVLELKGSKSTSRTGLRQTKQGQLLESVIHVYVYGLSPHPALCGLIALKLPTSTSVIHATATTFPNHALVKVYLRASTEPASCARTVLLQKRVHVHTLQN